MLYKMNSSNPKLKYVTSVTAILAQLAKKKVWQNQLDEAHYSCGHYCQDRQHKLHARSVWQHRRFTAKIQMDTETVTQEGVEMGRMPYESMSLHLTQLTWKNGSKEKNQGDWEKDWQHLLIRAGVQRSCHKRCPGGSVSIPALNRCVTNN